MNVKVRLFQEYTKYHDTPDFELELPAGTTAGDLIHRLGITGVDLAYLVLLTGGKRVHEDDVLNDGDELVFAAPAGGG